MIICIGVFAFSAYQLWTIYNTQDTVKKETEELEKLVVSSDDANLLEPDWDQLLAQNPDIGVMDAIGQSKELMRGHKGRLFWLSLTFIGWVLLSVLTFGIGFLWLNPYMEAAQAAFYLERTDQLPSTHKNSPTSI